MSMQARLVDITTLPVDAIVNAAREDLRPGSGVSAAIHRAAGPELLEACQRLGGCAVGSAVITSAYSLPCRFVVHAVGPVWQGGGAGEEAMLAAACRQALRLAHNNRAETVALPALGTGAGGFPIPLAASIAVQVVREALDQEGYLDEVTFACHREEELEAFQQAMEAVAG